MDLMSNSAGGESVSMLSENERKRLEAVWELFQSETVFLIDHLMVLKHVRIILAISNMWPFTWFFCNLVLVGFVVTPTFYRSLSHHCRGCSAPHCLRLIKYG